MMHVGSHDCSPRFRAFSTEKKRRAFGIIIIKSFFYETSISNWAQRQTTFLPKHGIFIAFSVSSLTQARIFGAFSVHSPLCLFFLYACSKLSVHPFWKMKIECIQGVNHQPDQRRRQELLMKDSDRFVEYSHSGLYQY
jgi:hypothetical protein